MDKEQYLFLLRAELTGRLSEGEIEDILRYYSEYFEEAGVEQERTVMLELGTPERLARQILGEREQEELVPLSAAYDPMPASPTRWAGLPRWLAILLLVAVGIVAVPSIFGVVLGFGIGGFICVLVGLGVTAGGIAWGGFAARLYLMGGGLIAVAIGIMLLLGAAVVVWAAAKGTRWLWSFFAEENDHEAFC